MNMMKPLMITAIASVFFISGCATTGNQHNPAAFAPAFPVVEQPPAPANGGLFQAGHSMNLFNDGKAYRVGDILTVMLEENTNAQKQASTSTNKNQSIDMPAPDLFGGNNFVGGFVGNTVGNVVNSTIGGAENFSAQVNQGRQFAGNGSSSQSNSLRGSITVFVSQVLPNGNLVVRGEKQLTLNQGSEYVRLSGIVRPSDIKPDNTVPSTRIANAEILYSGTGAMADANRMGWLARFFNGPLWPF